MKLSHENQSKYGRTCSGVAVGGALDGIGTTLGMLPLMTTAGIDGKGGGAVLVVAVVDVVDVLDVVADSGGDALQAASSAATAAVITITFLMEIIRSPFVRMSR
jgi:hypothetical protein